LTRVVGVLGAFSCAASTTVLEDNENQ
jgi:hypothetical protein